jgi:hypothetical protein
MILQFDIPNNPHKHRQFCTVLDDVYLTNTGKDLSDGGADGLISITHDGKKVKAGIHKDTQKMGDREIYFPNQFDDSTEYDEEIDEEVFLLFDDTGINYLHFFFDLFGKCIYYDILKQDKKLKLGIAADFWVDEGKNNHIKQWLSLYYENLEVVVFDRNKTYKIKQITLPNCLYWSPEQTGHQPIMEMISRTAAKIEPMEVKANGCYISRQDTIKHGWYHNREMANELELIDRIKNELNYDIIELMDYSLVDKIKIFKSYKNIIQQSSASNVNILFSSPKVTNIILSNPNMGPWINLKCNDYAHTSGCMLLAINDIGETIIDPNVPAPADRNNYPWRIVNLDEIMRLLTSIDDGSIWNSQ